MKRKIENKSIYVAAVELSVFAAIILYLVFMPNIIASKLEVNAYNEFLKVEVPEETFILNVWHIVEFKPHTGSLNNFFKEYSLGFEKSHKGVFAESTAMTVEEYEERIDRGERADIYSFPLSLLPKMEFKAFENTQTVQSLLFDTYGCGMTNGERMALPYALSGSFFVGNSELLEKENIGFTADNINELKSKAQDGEAFLNREAAVTVMNAGELGSFERRIEAGKGFDVAVLPNLNSAERLIQLIGISKDTENKKTDAAAEYISGLFENEWVKKLSELGLIPTFECEGEKMEFKNPYVRSYYELLCEKY